MDFNALGIQIYIDPEFISNSRAFRYYSKGLMIYACLDKEIGIKKGDSDSRVELKIWNYESGNPRVFYNEFLEGDFMCHTHRSIIPAKEIKKNEVQELISMHLPVEAFEKELESLVKFCDSQTFKEYVNFWGLW